MAWLVIVLCMIIGMTGKERLSYLQRRSEEYIKLREKWKTEYENDPKNISENMK